MNETTKAIFSRVDALAEKLGVAVQGLYEVLVHQARLEAYYDFGYAAVLLAVAGSAVCAMRFFWRLQAKESYNNWEIGAFISGLLAALFVIIALTVTTNAITALCNPQYWALKQLMGR